MAHYYLAASLPDIVLGEKPAMGMEEFRESCAGLLPEGQREALFNLLDGDLDVEAPGPAGVWAETEVQVRNARAKALAGKAGVEPGPYLRPHGRYFAEAERVVAEALGADDPLERELRLDRGRWRLAEDLALEDPFGFAAVVSYGIRLSMAWRWAAMDKERGGQKIDEFLSAVTAEYGEPA
jgi:hypothetical protein